MFWSAGGNGVNEPETAPRAEQHNGATRRPHPQPRALICPYCGSPVPGLQQCPRCKGLLDPLSRQASQNAMGPWAMRDESAPFRPGFSYTTLRAMVVRGKITRDSIVRGPPTRQFWTQARCTPGVAHLLGECHACHAPARSNDMGCAACGASFVVDDDRQHLGLAPVQLLPGHAPADAIAASLLDEAGGGSAAAAGTTSYPGRMAGQPALRGPRRLSLTSLVLLVVCMALLAALGVVLFGPRLGLNLQWLEEVGGGGEAG
jgi:hypothetical protein